jgi:death-on-curing protein
MRYLTTDDVIAINRVFEGEQHQLRDFGLLESAVLRPQTSVGGNDAYPDVTSKAAALFHSIVSNHAFLNGNKRTAVVALGVFLSANGYQLIAEQGEMIDLAMAVSDGLADVDEIAGMLKEITAVVWTHDESVEVIVVEDDPE